MNISIISYLESRKKFMFCFNEFFYK